MAGRVLTALFAVALLMPTTASAAPITSGVWSSVGATKGDNAIFWDGTSVDCEDCSVGGWLTFFGFGPLEYLHDGHGKSTSFIIDDPDQPWTMLFALSKWDTGQLTLGPDGAFTYDSGTGHVSNSLQNGAQFALFRQVGPDSTRYFLGIEDVRLDGLLESDRDYNDYVATFSQPTAIPEPGTLILVGTALFGLGSRRFRR